MPSDIIVVERKLLKSEAFRKLNGTAKTVYFDFRMKCQVKSVRGNGSRKPVREIRNNGEIEYTYSEAEKKKPKIPRSSFMRAINDLLAFGFVDIYHSGSGGKKGDKSLYGISDRWQHFGTDKFKYAERLNDDRTGRGFQPGNDHWKKIMGVESET